MNAPTTLSIANIMLSPIFGGIEQAFLDYNAALTQRGHHLVPITHPKGIVNRALRERGFEPTLLGNFGRWDPFAVARLRRGLRAIRPDIVVTHTSRSFAIARAAVGADRPIVAVVHNYKYDLARLQSASGVITVSRDLVRHLVDGGLSEHRVFRVPNMVHPVPSASARAIRQVPVIGAFGRFEPVKGFDLFIRALGLLKRRGIDFHAVLGGAGAQDSALRALAEAEALDGTLTFSGWVSDKARFFSDIDVFVLPSRLETFGIVLLEAFVHATPVVATAVTGPCEVIADGVDGLLAEPENPSAMAAAIERVITDPALSHRMTAAGLEKARALYSSDVVVRRIEGVLRCVLAAAA